MQKRIAVLVSGSGSNLEALLAYKPKLPIVLVIADRPCKAADLAEAKGLQVERLYRPHGRFFDRRHYTLRLQRLLFAAEIDLVVMAGFMTMLHAVIFTQFNRRILNVHPSLLPKFKGAHAVRDTLAAGEKWTGSTVQIAKKETDAGVTLAQSREQVRADDTEQTLQERLKKKEHLLYPWVVERYLAQLPEWGNYLGE